MNLSLFTGFLFFPFGISVHICEPSVHRTLDLKDATCLLHILKDLHARLR